MSYDQWSFAFGLFIAAHKLTDEQLKDTEYLKDLYENFKEENESE